MPLLCPFFSFLFLYLLLNVDVLQSSISFCIMSFHENSHVRNLTPHFFADDIWLPLRVPIKYFYHSTSVCMCVRVHGLSLLGPKSPVPCKNHGPYIMGTQEMFEEGTLEGMGHAFKLKCSNSCRMLSGTF